MSTLLYTKCLRFYLHSLMDMASIAEKILPLSKCYIDALNPTMMSPMRLINETENELKPKSA